MLFPSQSHVANSPFPIGSRKENIFSPLGMSRSSFYLLPHIKERKVGMSYRRPNDGQFQPWDHRFYEEDPSKCMCFLSPPLLHSRRTQTHSVTLCSVRSLWRRIPPCKCSRLFDTPPTSPPTPFQHPSSERQTYHIPGYAHFQSL